MKKLVIPFNDIPQLSSKDKAYSTGNQHLKPFYKHAVNIDSFQQVISDKSTQDIPRKLIVEVLKDDLLDLVRQPASARRRNLRPAAAEGRHGDEGL